MDQSWKFTIGICLIILVVGADNMYDAHKAYQEDVVFIDKSFATFKEVLDDQADFYLEVLNECYLDPAY